MTLEIFESMARTVTEEAGNGIMWAKAWFVVGFFFISIGIFIFFNGTLSRQKKDDVYAGTVIFCVMGLILGGLPGGVSALSEFG